MKNSTRFITGAAAFVGVALSAGSPAQTALTYKCI